MKRFLSLLLISSFMLVILSACAAPNDEATPGADAQEQLTLWDVIVRTPHPEARDMVIAAFLEENPHVSMEVSTLTGDINQVILTAAAGNTLPDVVFVWGPGDVITWGQMGIIAPVDNIVDYFGRDWWLSQRQLEMYQMDGHTWGVPIVSFPIVFWYRADWFNEAGLAVPTTWDEWYNAAVALTDRDANRFGSVFGIAEGWPWHDLRGSNADYWWDRDGNITIDSRSVETLDFLRRMFDETAYPGSVAFTNEGQRVGFLSDMGATMVTSVSFVNTIMEEVGLEWFTEGIIGVAPVPMNATPEQGAGAGAATHAIGLIDGPNLELAETFLRFWLSEDSLVTYFSNNIPGHLPPYRVVWNSPQFRNAHADYWEVYGAGYEIIATTQWFHPPVGWEAIFNADGGGGAQVMSAVTIERIPSADIVSNLIAIAENARAEIE